MTTIKASPLRQPEDLLSSFMPRRLARIVLFQSRGWQALAALPGRLRRGPGRNEYPYSSGMRLVMAIVFCLVVIEVPILLFLALLLVPWVWLRVTILVVGLYLVWWVGATWAGMVTQPHVMRDESLELRAGLLARMVIPTAAIDAARYQEHHWRGSFGPLLEAGEVAFPVGGQTEICLQLREPVRLWRLFGRDVTAARVHIHSDLAGRLLSDLQERID